MLCTTVAERVVTLLKNKKPGTTIQADVHIPVINCIDPEALFGTEVNQNNQFIGVFAFNTTFKVEGRGSNKRITSKTFTIVISISKTFPPQEPGQWDAVKWETAKPYQDLQQLINECLAENPIEGVTLADINQEPPQDLMLSQRFFLAGTEVTYNWVCT